MKDKTIDILGLVVLGAAVGVTTWIGTSSHYERELAKERAAREELLVAAAQVDAFCVERKGWYLCLGDDGLAFRVKKGVTL